MLAKSLISLVQSINENTSVSKTIDLYKNRLRKSGIRVSQIGKKTVLYSPKMRRRVQFTDTGRDVRIRRIDRGLMDRERKARGMAPDISQEIDWINDGKG